MRASINRCSRIKVVSWFLSGFLALTLVGEAFASTLWASAPQNGQATLNWNCTTNAYCKLMKQSNGVYVEIWGAGPGAGSKSFSVVQGQNLYRLDSYNGGRGGIVITEQDYATVNVVDTPPSISSISNKNLYTNQNTGNINFNVSDAETPASSLIVSASSSSTYLVASSGITLAGSGGNRTIKVSPVAGRTGQATITLSVKDTANQVVTTSFVLTVSTPPPQLPTYTGDPLVTIPDPVNDALDGSVWFGYTKGASSVADDGSFIYTVPIAVPAGVQDMAPSLALTYNSSAGNGLLGLGWRLTGLSKIHRCNADVVRDAQFSNLLQGYKYCLNGERLIRISSTQYRTESESFNIIEKSGDSWVVTSPEGEVSYFGLSSIAREADNQSATHTWHLSKVQDIWGNYFSVNYSKGTYSHRPASITYTENAQLPSAPYQIVFDYEVRDDRRVSYVHGTRSDLDRRLSKIRVNVDGDKVWEYKLAYQEYGQSYLGRLYSDPMKNSRLASLQRCYPSGNCQQAVQFDWSEQTEENYAYQKMDLGVEASTPPGPSQGQYTPYVELDIDNDGVMEYWSYPSTAADSEALSVLYLKDSDSSPGTGGTESRSVRPVYRAADINGDGFQDIVRVSNAGNGIKVFLNIAASAGGREISSSSSAEFNLDGTSLSFDGVRSYWHLEFVFPQGNIQVKETVSRRFGYKILFLDMNSDGKADLVRMPPSCESAEYVCSFLDPNNLPADMDAMVNRGNQAGYPSDISVLFNTGNGWSTNTGGLNFIELYDSWYNFQQEAFPQFVDMNGDGALDLYGFVSMPQNSASSYYYLEHNGKLGSDSAYTLVESGQGGSFGQYIGDFNGDGIRTAIVVGSEADTDFCSPGGSGGADWRCRRTVLDYNNDGMDDIVEYGYKYASGNWDIRGQVSLSLGADSSGGDIFSQPIEFVSSAIYQSEIGSSAPASFISNPFRDLNNDGFPEYISELKNGLTRNVIERVIEGGSVLSVAYTTFADTAIYTDIALDGGNADQIAFENSIYTVQRSGLAKQFGVKRLSITNGIGGESYTDYSYSGAAIHVGGYGSLGFAKRETVDTFSETNESIRTVTEYLQKAESNFLLAGVIKRKQVYVTPKNGSEKKISDLRNNWKVITRLDDYDYSTDGKRSPHYFPYIYQSSVSTWSLDGGLVSNSRTHNYSGSASCSTLSLSSIENVATSTTYSDYTSDGVLRYSLSTSCDTSGSSSAVHVTATSMENIIAKGLRRGLVQRVNQQAWLGSSLNEFSTGAFKTRALAYTYNANGSLYTKIIEPDAGPDSTLWFKTTYSYNDVGDVTSALDNWRDTPYDGLDFTQRNSILNISYHADGSKTVVSTKPLIGSTTTIYDAAFGLPTSVIDENNLNTINSYDELGRLALVTYPNLTTQQIDYRSCSNCFLYSDYEAWYSQTKLSGTSAERTYFDSLNRPVGSRNRGWDGSYVYSVQHYNSRGEIESQSAPFYASDTRQLTFHEYDVLGRSTKTTTPNEGISTKVYSKLKVVSTNAELQTQTRHMNAKGWVIKSIDNHNTPVEFTYTPFGDLKTTKVNGDSSTLVTIEYDDLGRKKELHDPDAGSIYYTVNALGLISSQTDGNNKVTRFTFDQLGRERTRTDNATGASPRTHTTSYDASFKGLPDGLTGKTTEGNNYIENYTYTGYGQLKTLNAQFLGKNLTLKHGYDNYGRALDVTYPTGYRVATIYNTWGYNSSTVAAMNNQLLWEANEVDASGRVTQATLGDNSVTTKGYDEETGFVTSALVQKNSQTIMSQAYQFDLIGNLEQRNDALNNVTESFCYDGLNRLKASRFNGCGSSSNDFNYDDLGNITYKQGVGSYTYQSARPHAVRTANGLTYSYDNAGNMTQAVNSSNQIVRSVSYSDFNKPTLISNEGKWSSLEYGPSKVRAKRADNSGRTIYYFAGVFEITQLGSKTEFIHSIGDSARYIQRVDPIGGDASYHEFIHRDHIGSEVARTTDEVSATVAREAFDAWGIRLDTAWDGVPFGPTYVSSSSRGYTSHEHLDEVGLIHMNGRVYDPELARFLSPDLFIQAPTNTQSYNRYSYVMNNPLSFTDPSGYICVGPDSSWDNFVSSGIDFASSWGLVGAMDLGLLDKKAKKNSKSGANKKGDDKEDEDLPKGEKQVIKKSVSDNVEEETAQGLGVDAQKETESTNDRILRLRNEVLEDFPDLASDVKIKVIDTMPKGYEGFGLMLDDKSIIVALNVDGSAVSDSQMKATIFHETLHVMEARHFGFSTANDFARHQIKLYGGHNKWVVKVDKQYQRYLMGNRRKLPDISKANWLRK